MNFFEFYIVIIMFSFVFIFVFGMNVWSKVVKCVGFKCILMVGLLGYSLGIFVFVSVWMVGFFGIISGINLFLVLLIS